MSTTTQPLKYLWIAYFEDGHTIYQPQDDKYSKHDDTAEWNPSAFRDVLEYESKLVSFGLVNDAEPVDYFTVDLEEGSFHNLGVTFSLESEPLIDRKIIFFREVLQHRIDDVVGEPYVNRYAIGYEGKNSKGKIEKKMVYING